MQLWADDVEREVVVAGEIIRMKVKNVDESEVSKGFVLCSCPPESACPVARTWDAQIIVLECKSILSAGFTCMMHVHEAVEEVCFVLLIVVVDRRTGERGQVKPKFLKQDQAAIVRLRLLNPQGAICLETFKDVPAMVYACC